MSGPASEKLSAPKAYEEITMSVDSEIRLAGELRPDHIVSLTGYEKDAAVVANIKPVASYTHVEVTLETGVSKTLPIDLPVSVYSE